MKLVGKTQAVVDAEAQAAADAEAKRVLKAQLQELIPSVLAALIDQSTPTTSIGKSSSQATQSSAEQAASDDPISAFQDLWQQLQEGASDA